MDNRNLNELDRMVQGQVNEDLKSHPDDRYMKDLYAVMATFIGRRFMFQFIERSGIFTPGSISKETAIYNSGYMASAQVIIGLLRATEGGTSLLNTMFSENLKGADNVPS